MTNETKPKKEWDTWFWPQETYLIQKIQENKNPYKTGILILIALAVVLGGLLMGMDVLFGTLLIFAPLAYLICRNYRVGYILFLLVYSADKIMTILQTGKVGSALVFWMIAIGCSVSAVRLLTLKKKLQGPTRTKWGWDILACVGIVLLVFILQLIAILIFKPELAFAN